MENRKPGRPLGDSWSHFHRVTSGAVVKAKCKACETVVLGKPECRAKHLAVCAQVAPEIGQGARDELPNILGRLKEGRQSLGKRKLEEAAKNPKLKQPMFSVSAVKSVGKDEQHALDVQLTKALVSGNVPFVFVDNPDFKKFCLMMRGTTYNLPDRHDVSGKLLEEVHGEVQAERQTEMKNETGTLCVDGWSDIKGDPTLGFSFARPGPGFFLGKL